MQASGLWLVWVSHQGGRAAEVPAVLEHLARLLLL